MLTKRCFDLIVGAILLVLSVPLMSLAAAMVKLDSPGPVIFRQQRLGLGKRAFTLLKFRSMRVPGHPSETIAASDPRITRSGRFLRATHLDELPQLWNVLRGDMSLVGPRPTTPEKAQMRSREIAHYDDRFLVPAGLTGIPQLFSRQAITRRGHRGIHLLDRYYRRRRSLLLDCKILLHTARAILGRRGT